MGGKPLEFNLSDGSRSSLCLMPVCEMTLTLLPGNASLLMTGRQDTQNHTETLYLVLTFSSQE